MATQIQLRRGTTAQHSGFTGAVAEVTVDTDKETVVVHDGSTAGGYPLATEAQVNDRLQVANATATFVTKAIAVSSNNALVNLINDRMQVANVSSLVSTEVSNLVDSAPEALNTLNELAAALGDDSNFATTTATTLGTKASNTYVNSTFQTIAVERAALANTNASIATKIAITDARVEFLQSANTSITGDASSITTTQSDVDLNDEALVNPAGFITLNIGGTDYKLPFFS